VILHTLFEAVFGEDSGWTVFAWLLIIAGALLTGCAAWVALPAWRETARREPRWPALAFLGVAVALAATGLWLLLKPDQRSGQERAVAAIKRLQGEVTRDDQVPGQPVVKVSFRESQAPLRGLTDTGLASLRPHLEALSQLRELDLCRTDITDKGLSELRGLTQLKTLILGSQMFPNEKRLLYARAGIRDYWVVDINGRRLLVYRDPQSGEYATQLVLGTADTVSPLAAPAAVVRVADLRM
jgi:hypothetical protein